MAYHYSKISINTFVLPLRTKFKCSAAFLVTSIVCPEERPKRSFTFNTIVESFDKFVTLTKVPNFIVLCAAVKNS